ncbi:MAG: cysteine desulfurase [Erysipelotrichaceae bacterium]|nr:cysteine desulfurase [Erysipelotrichaceae bacterium]MDY5251380.1 cysteine desulfurase family protein [Erysipelotrichaceae bacterium]
MQRKLYLDCASTTPIHPEVLATYTKLLNDSFYNVDALYDDATTIKKMMEKSREATAKLLNVDSEEILFTSGASEANSLATKGLALKNQHLGRHIITSAYEHASVLNAIKQLEETFGFEVTYLKPNENGIISEQMVKQALRNDTILVSIMHVNNEVGAINPVESIAKIVKYDSNAFMHVDETQALGKIKINLKDIDLASFSAHKIEGLKGSGILYKKRHVELLALINGGQQEHNLRGGTSNALVNILFAKTLRIALENQQKYAKHLHALHDHFIQCLQQEAKIQINSLEPSVDAIINFSCRSLTSEVMLNALNARGIMVSALSTCHSKSSTSHVLASLGYDDDRIKHSLRVSFDHHLTIDDIDYFMANLKEIIQKYD